MSDKRPVRLMFLTWESPWPAQAGGTLRTLGMLKELSKVYDVEMVVLCREPLSEHQKVELGKYTTSIVCVPMAAATLKDRVRIFARMLTYGMPYHCTVVHISFYRVPDILEQVRTFPGVVYASYGHWGTLVKGCKAPKWILDQQNADVQFWRVYASQASNPWLKIAALVNWRLAAAHFSRIYSSVGRVISVCEEDRQLTLAMAPQTQVHVIENGVSCSYYVPDRTSRTWPPRLLFTGTSAPRNVTALRRFGRKVWPLVQREVPEAELLVAGNFKPEAQVGFRQYKNIRFTGKVEDMRPYFNQSDVFIAPFDETHGSKLKIAEAMAMGIAIVSTPEGIRGFSLVDGESVLIAYSNEQFAAHVVGLLRDASMQERLGCAARQVALATIDWQVLGKRIASIVEDTLRALPEEQKAQG